MVVHVAQVHKESISKVPNALPDREDPTIEIFGSQGIPEEARRTHLKSVDDSVTGSNVAAPTLSAQYPPGYKAIPPTSVPLQSRAYPSYGHRPPVPPAFPLVAYPDMYGGYPTYRPSPALAQPAWPASSGWPPNTYYAVPHARPGQVTMTPYTSMPATTPYPSSTFPTHLVSPTASLTSMTPALSPLSSPAAPTSSQAIATKAPLTASPTFPSLIPESTVSSPSLLSTLASTAQIVPSNINGSSIPSTPVESAAGPISVLFYTDNDISVVSNDVLSSLLCVKFFANIKILC
jgi:hypothetical protein